MNPALPRAAFIFLLVFTLTPWASPPIALTLGLAFGLTFTNPFRKQSQSASKWLLQASVVGLGFGMSLHKVISAGKDGFVYTLLGIVFALGLGMLLGNALRVKPTAAFLISAGTAICGGSAIAAVGPIAGASEEEMSVSLGTVFILNSIALLTFPYIGNTIHLSQNQFGLWAALAIHDTSSVVGAAAKYGAEALAIATTVKLARALWIVPLSLATAGFTNSKAKIKWPWFILFFVIAAILASYVPQGERVFAFLYAAGKVGLTATLFLIGAGVSRATLKQVGPRPLLQGIALWIVVGTVSLMVIRYGVIGI